MNAVVQQRYLDIPALRRLAPNNTYDAAKRTVQVMWSAGAQVRRYDWWNDEYWIEELDLKTVDLSRLKAGAPVLDSHNRQSVGDVVGS